MNEIEKELEAVWVREGHPVSPCIALSRPGPGCPAPEVHLRRLPTFQVRQCPVNLACAALRGWEAFLAHIHEVHTSGTEAERRAAVQAILERGRRPVPESAVVPKVTAHPGTEALWHVLRADVAKAREIVMAMGEPDREALRVQVAVLLVLARNPEPGADLCQRCFHRKALHDSEGCTVTIPQTEDPEFGPTQTCPCCEKGPLR